MVFSSVLFLFIFMPVTIGIYFILPKPAKNTWLFIMSFIFYAWGGMAYALLVLFSTIVNYITGLLMDKQEGSKRKICLAAGVAYNLFVLFFFKYFNFVVENIKFVLGPAGNNINPPLIPLPIGISFFTFQIMSYIIDLYRKEIKVQKNFINLGLYILLFPQLIAGPIVRYIDVEEKISKRSVDLDSFSHGLKRFILGLGKKIIIANAMGEWADIAFNDISRLSTPMAWLGIAAYTLQIFFDFSAYSDMAIGLGEIFGFHFLENFNYPYGAVTIQDFWRKWHMSLTTWFRDYLYIPLGGNRKGAVRTYINNFIVFFMTGLWHGAAWNFILWGLFHGFFQIVEKTLFGKYIRKLPAVLGHIYTMLIVMVGWVLFRADTLGDALKYCHYMFSYNIKDINIFFSVLDNWKIFVLVLAVLFSVPFTAKINTLPVIQKHITAKKYADMVLYTMLFIISIMFVSGSSFNPFIYFRF